MSINYFFPGILIYTCSRLFYFSEKLCFFFRDKMPSIISAFNTFIFALPGVLLAGIYAKFMHDLHENTLWFSNIREIEKEISFRTESGLYYSYYKSLVSSNSFWGTLFDFTRDTSTEFPRSINVLQRFNIYPEVLIAALHKIVSVYYAVPAIMFYVYCSFFLSGLSLFGVYLLAWIYGGSWFQGFIAGVWMIVNYEDSSRVNFAVNLREVYALPFLWLQYVIIVRSIQGASFSRIPFVVTTFLFAVSWQFNQFILMLQSLSMFTFTLICPSFQLLLREVVSAQTLGFFLVVLVQFLQPMALFSPLIFMNITIYYFSFRVPSKFNVVKTVFIMLVLLALVFAYNLAIKVVIGNSSDTHIRTFVIAKLGIPLDNSSFETNLYLCHSAFAYLGYDFIERTMKNGLLQAFSVSFVLTLGSLIKEWWLDQPLSPLQTLLSIKSIVFGLLAFTTMRMKYVFLPHALIIASAAFSFFDRFFGRFHKFFKFAVIMSLAFSISRTHFNFYLKVMSHEQVSNALIDNVSTSTVT